MFIKYSQTSFFIVDDERHFEDYLYCLTTSWRYFTYKLWREGGRGETVDTGTVWVWGGLKKTQKTSQLSLI